MMLTVALDIVHQGVQRIAWDDYPDIGEHDFTRILAVAEDYAGPPLPAALDEALNYFKERAEK
jgi:hypothetical protein